MKIYIFQLKFVSLMKKIFKFSQVRDEKGEGEKGENLSHEKNDI